MKIAVIIPSYKVKEAIVSVLQEIPDIVSRVYVVDDNCPQGSGQFASETISDPRIKYIYSEKNSGVGGAAVRGYRAALREHYDIYVKLDGDGQMNPKNIPDLIDPILKGEGDYAKGNRLYSYQSYRKIPPLRLLGIYLYSLVNRFATGYWHVSDSVNGYTAITHRMLQSLDLNALHQGYFFESDMLLHLSTLRARVCDVNIPASYGDEVSGMRLYVPLFVFPVRYFYWFFRFLKK